MKCKENSGILFNHPCDQPSTLSCAACNKPICQRHMRYRDDKPTCISCIRTGLSERRARGQTGTGGNDRYDDDPYFFYYYGGYGGDDDPYTDSDFSLFDGGDAGDAYAMDEAGAWAGS